MLLPVSGIPTLVSAFSAFPSGSYSVFSSSSSKEVFQAGDFKMYRKVMKSMQGQTKVIAVAGKGGVGKTSLAAAMVISGRPTAIKAKPSHSSIAS